MSKTSGRIITFYSYKGGTGRSMALANFAWLLAAEGKKVLVIDWDLEAPGLHRYFRPFLSDPDLRETEGLIDCFWTLATSAAAKTVGEEYDEAQVAEAIDDSIRTLRYDFGCGGIDFLGAGRQDENFSFRVSNFNWKQFFDIGGAQIISQIKDKLNSEYDFILIDSRTGVSDTAGICTIQLPESVVACFTLNRQSIEGVASVLASIRAYRSDTVNGANIAFYPLATRIENAEQARLEAARGYARTLMAEFVPAEVGSKREYWDAMEISYRPAYAFEEVLAIFGDASGAAGAADTMLAQFGAMASKISTLDLTVPEIPEIDRREVLRKYSLGGANYEEPRENPTATEVKEDGSSFGLSIDDQLDKDFIKSLYAKEMVWRQRDRHWIRLLNEHDLSLLLPEDTQKFGRRMSHYLAQSRLMEPLYKFARFWRIISLSTIFTYTVLTSARITSGRFYYTDDEIFISVIVFVSIVIAPLIALTLFKPPIGFSALEFLRLCIRLPFLDRR